MKVSRHARTAIGALVLTLAASTALAQGLALKTVEFSSPAVGRTMKYNILLPQDYDTSTKRYPVLYLMHGLTQNYTVWGLQNGTPFYAGPLRRSDRRDARRRQLLVRELGRERRRAEEQLGRPHRRATSSATSIGTTGRSRGARGAPSPGCRWAATGRITLGLRHPELFISIGSTSGALEHGAAGGGADCAAPQTARRRRRRGQPSRRRRVAGRTPLMASRASAARKSAPRRVGSSPRPEDADAYDPFKLIAQVPKEKLPHIYLDCGTEDRLIAGARELAAILLEKNIPFDYMQMPGAHNSAYWIQSIGRIMAVQYEVMQRRSGSAAGGATSLELRIERARREARDPRRVNA